MNRWIPVGEGIWRNADDSQRVERHECVFAEPHQKPFAWFTHYAKRGHAWVRTGWKPEVQRKAA